MAALEAGSSGATTSERSLLGSKCLTCAVVAYPQASSCPRCGADMAAHTLSEHGTVWSWTVQRYAPKSPPFIVPEGGHQPFVVGYIEVEDGLRVEAVVESSPDQMRIGMPVYLRGGDGVPRATVRSEG